jgi:hypothetical protein
VVWFGLVRHKITSVRFTSHIADIAVVCKPRTTRIELGPVVNRLVSVVHRFGLVHRSLVSRGSQKSPLLNRFVWYPIPPVKIASSQENLQCIVPLDHTTLLVFNGNRRSTNHRLKSLAGLKACRSLVTSERRRAANPRGLRRPRNSPISRRWAGLGSWHR